MRKFLVITVGGTLLYKTLVPTFGKGSVIEVRTTPEGFMIGSKALESEWFTPHNAPPVFTIEEG